jgi:hypothetical protein
VCSSGLSFPRVLLALALIGVWAQGWLVVAEVVVVGLGADACMVLKVLVCEGKLDSAFANMSSLSISTIRD